MAKPIDDREASLAVRDVLLRYATGIDRRDWARFRTCFTDDCVADYGTFGTWTDAESLTVWMEEAHRALGPTMHRITNEVVAVDGATATARSYVDAVLVAADGASGSRALGFYDDELVHDEAGWRIARRQFTMVLFQPNFAADVGTSGD